MKRKVLTLALLGMGIGLAGTAHADLAGGLAAYEDGRCDEAVSALTPVAEAGDAAAQTALGDLYMNKDRRCQDWTRNARKAEPWYLLAARSGNTEAQRQLIAIYDVEFAETDRGQSTKWIANLAALGGANDLYELATRRQRAEGVAYDRVLAHAFFLMASRRPDKAEGVDLAAILERGAAEMSPEQLAEAESIATAWKVGAPLPSTSVTGRRDPRDWYKASAEKGDIEAAYKLGTLYWKSDYGLSVDPKLAEFWLRKAAQGGSADAQQDLSNFYAMGYGVPKDYVLGYTLHRLAVQGGGKEALRHEDAWDDTLTEQQLGEADALIAQWKKGDALPRASRYGMQRKVNYVEHARGELAPTPEVLALFKSASEGDEAEFTRLLAKVDHLNDYLVEGDKLLHALLLPAASLRAEADAWRREEKDARDTAHWQTMQARHAALLPAKTRMLALALARGASIDEGTGRDNAAPLHLAAMFGTPEMVGMLLKQGADPRQFGGQNSMLAPLEFALEQKEHGRGVPELITPQQRTGNILALLQAGALRPYIRYDIENKRKKNEEDKISHPFADYLMWPAVLSQTRGTEVLDALLKTGTSPADSEEGKTLFDFAAEAGNAGAIAWLKQRLPRYDKDQRDLWLDAAMLAMHSNAPERDQVLQQLLVKDMHWQEQGPQQEGSTHDYRTLYAGSAGVGFGTLLNHATRARRFEWIPKLAALGAPVSAGGSEEDLANAARDNDAGSVKALLAQGADPLAGADPALSMALAAPGDDDAVLDLLLDHIVRVQKKSLSKLRNPPLEQVLTGANPISVARVRKLINAGAPVQDLSENAIDAAFAAPDPDVATLLIQRGLLRNRAPAAKPGAPRFLFVAIRSDRTDLLPSILAQGENPNRRNKLNNGGLQPSPVDYAISQGNMEALDMLLAHGGVIDTATFTPWGTALDRAVASLDADMLRKVSKNFSLPLKRACLYSNIHLAKVVLESPASYWALLREHGFGTGSDCGNMQETLALHLSRYADPLLEGWLGQNLVERLPQLGSRRGTFGADTWASIADSKNPPLAALLEKAGWVAPASPAVVEAEAKPVPQQASADDLALQATLPGHYYLRGVTEVGAEILLRPNGKFEYSMAYGAVDEYAHGSWKVLGQQVVFRSESATARAASMRPSTGAPPITVIAGRVRVEMRYHGKIIPGLKIALLGDAPLKAEGRTGAQGWYTTFDAPVRQIAISHPEVNDNKWMVYTVPAADARRGTYQLDFEPPAPPQARFDHTLAVRDGSLLMQRGESELVFEKH